MNNMAHQYNLRYNRIPSRIMLDNMGIARSELIQENPNLTERIVEQRQENNEQNVTDVEELQGNEEVNTQLEPVIARQILDELRLIRLDIQTIQDDIVGIERRQNSLETKYARLENDVYEIKNDLKLNQIHMDRLTDSRSKENTEIHTRREIDEYNNMEHIGSRSDDRNIYITCPNSIIQQEIPKFDERTNPMQFLEEAENYYYLTIQNSSRKSLSQIELRNLISRMLVGPANEWWSMHNVGIRDFEEFKVCFEEKYWNYNIQMTVRRSIESGKYNDNGRLSRTAYFTRKVLILKHLRPRLPEREILRILGVHFDRSICDAITTQVIKTLKDMEMVLDEADLMSRIVRNRQDDNRYNRQRVDLPGEQQERNDRPRYNRGNNNERYHDRREENRPRENGNDNQRRYYPNNRQNYNNREQQNRYQEGRDRNGQEGQGRINQIRVEEEPGREVRNVQLGEGAGNLN